MEVTGKVKVIGETETFGAKGFRKRNLVITTNEQYPQDLQLEFVQDKVDLLDNYKVGQNVKVGVNLRGREWINPEGVAKYFNTIQGWRIEAEAETTESEELPPLESLAKDKESDGLPF